MKWIHGREALEAFLETANSFHSTIRFTAEVFNDKHVFLGTMPHLADDKVVVDLYSKPTDSHQYVLPTSCHPAYCSNNIPYSPALRIRSDDEAVEKRLKDLSEHLNKRCYQKEVIDQAIETIKHMDRQNILSYKPKPTAHKVVLAFVMTYHPDLPKVRGIVDKHWSTIESSEHKSQAWPSDEQKVPGIILCRLDWSQTPSMMSLLENANPVADQDVKPVK